jgi:hypothetical protein
MIGIFAVGFLAGVFFTFLAFFFIGNDLDKR